VVLRDIVEPPARSWSTWRLLSLILWIVPLAAISIMVIARPGHRSVTPVYHQAVDQWWARQPLYEGATGFHYLPHFTAVFIPYHCAGNRVGDVLWRCTAGLGLAAGLWLFCGAITHRRPDRWRAFVLASLYALPLSLAALQNGQANAHFGVLLLLAAWCLHARKWAAAVVCLWLAAAIKPLGLAALGLAWAAYPQLWWRLALGLPVFLVFPFAFGPPGYVWSQCLAAWDNLRLCSVASEHRFADLNGLLRTFGIPLAGMASLAVRAGAGVSLMLFCYFGARRAAEPRRALLWLCAAVGFLMVFNPMTEANSYVILAPALGLMALWELTRGTPSLGWLLGGMALTMGVLPNLLRPLFGNAFALAWHPAMTIGFLSVLVWQVWRPRRLPAASNVGLEESRMIPEKCGL
jgi:alpha-1,2-mannosyltransferase